MNFFGQEPIDNEAMQILVVEGMRRAGQLEWSQATAFLESAMIVAPAEIIPQLLDALVMYYVKDNAYKQLANILTDATSFTPNTVIGGLLLERNRRYGLTMPPMRPEFFPGVMESLRAYLSQESYSLEELAVIQSLLVQLGEAELAFVILREFFEGKTGALNEEMITASLSLAVETKDDAVVAYVIAALERLTAGSKSAADCIHRYKILVGQANLQNTVDCGDKVVNFLQRKFG